MMRALELLNYIGALDDEGELTHLGRQMADFPLDPQLSKMIIESVKYNCSSEVVSLVALLSVPNIFMRPRDQQKQADAAKAQFDDDDGDHLALIKAFQGYKDNDESSNWCWDNYLNHRSLRQADNVREQLIRIMQRLKLDLNSTPPSQEIAFSVQVRKALTSAFFMQVAHLEKTGGYLTVKDNQVNSNPSHLAGCSFASFLWNERKAHLGPL
jgi:pre-mRNA-splicing factor ATP-dependent RNA helicase DHX15/PRP43